MTPTSNHRPRTLSIGGATYDLFVRTGVSHLVDEGAKKELRLPLGAKIHVEGVIETCGGGASNTSVGLARLGCDAGFCGVIGSDQWGQRLLENFRKEGVDASAVTEVEGEMTSFSLILSATSGERVILYETGTNQHMHDAVFDKAAAYSCDWIFLNHIHDRSCIIEDDLIEIVSKDGGPGLSWNPGGCHLKKGLDDADTKAVLAVTDLLFLNKEEALQFTGYSTVEDAIKALLKTGVQVVCITDGKNGVTASDGNKLYRCPVIEGSEIIDTTGAGDAFGSGVTWGKLQGLSLPEMLRAGTINATSVLGSFGAQAGLLKDTQIRTRLAESTPVVQVLDFPS